MGSLRWAILATPMSPGHPYAIVPCDACDQPIGDKPGGSGLLMFAYGEDRVRFEQPPLCERCALAVGMTALVRWAEEEEEG